MLLHPIVAQMSALQSTPLCLHLLLLLLLL
jgi:hypothetical protein